jgi:hypothetical protein
VFKGCTSKEHQDQAVPGGIALPSGSLGVSSVVQFSYLRMDEGGNCELIAYHCCCQGYGRYVMVNSRHVVG